MDDPDHGDSASAAMELVKSRRPETFGTGLVMAWAAARRANQDARKEILRRFVTAHGAEFKDIPPEHWPEIGVLFRAAGNWNRPWDLTTDERLVLAPLIEVEHRYLAQVAGQLMVADQWEDFHRSGYGFIELSSHAFISAAGTDPVLASALAEHVLSLLGKPSRIPGPRPVNTPEDPQMEWIFRAANTQPALAVLRQVVERPGLLDRRPPAQRDKINRMLDDAGRRLAR
jgi:hypothetical protein